MTIPPNLTFNDLALEIADDGRLMYFPVPLAEVIRHNGGEPDPALMDEDLAMHWIAQWYLAHREAGGEVDPVVDNILANLRPTHAQ